MIIGVNLTSGYAESASNPYNTASVTLSAGRLILVSLVADGGFVTRLTTVGGPSFTQVGLDVTQLGIKTSVWSAVPASDFTGVFPSTLTRLSLTCFGALIHFPAYRLQIQSGKSAVSTLRLRQAPQ